MYIHLYFEFQVCVGLVFFGMGLKLGVQGACSDAQRALLSVVGGALCECMGYRGF